MRCRVVHVFGLAGQVVLLLLCTVPVPGATCYPSFEGGLLVDVDSSPEYVPEGALGLGLKCCISVAMVLPSSG